MTGKIQSEDTGTGTYTGTVVYVNGIFNCVYIYTCYLIDCLLLCSMQLHIDLYIYISLNRKADSPISRCSIHFSGVQKPFQQGECDFQPLLWEKYPKRNNWKPNIASPNVGLKWCVFVSPGDSYWSRGTRADPTIELRLKTSLASLAAQQDGEASEDIAALVGAAEMQAFCFFLVCVCVFFSLGWWKWLAT